MESAEAGGFMRGGELRIKLLRALPRAVKTQFCQGDSVHCDAARYSSMR